MLFSVIFPKPSAICRACFEQRHFILVEVLKHREDEIRLRPVQFADEQGHHRGRDDR